MDINERLTSLNDTIIYRSNWYCHAFQNTFSWIYSRSFTERWKVDRRADGKGFWYQEFNIHYELLLKHFGQQKVFMSNFWNSFCSSFLHSQLLMRLRNPFHMTFIPPEKHPYDCVLCLSRFGFKTHKIDIKRHKTRIISENFRAVILVWGKENLSLKAICVS